MKQMITIFFCLFPLLVAARPTTGGGAVRPTTDTVVVHPTTQDTLSRPVTTVSVFHPTTPVVEFQAPSVNTFPAPKSMESYMTAGKGSSSGADSKEKKNNGLSPAKDLEKATSFSPDVDGFAQTPEKAAESEEFKDAQARVEEAKRNLKEKAFQRFSADFEDSIKNKAKAKSQGGKG